MRCGDEVRRRRTSPVVNALRIIDPQMVIARNSGYSAVFMMLPNPLATVPEVLAVASVEVSTTATPWFTSLSLAVSAAFLAARARSPVSGFSTCPSGNDSSISRYALASSGPPACANDLKLSGISGPAMPASAVSSTVVCAPISAVRVSERNPPTFMRAMEPAPDV